MKNKIIYSFLIIAFFLPLTIFALEVEYPSIPEGTVTQGVGLPSYIAWWFNFLIRVGFVAVFAVIVYSGFLYVTSAGRSEKISEAKSRFTAAIIGLIILLTSYLIIATLNPDLLDMKEPEVFRVTGLYVQKREDGKTIRQAIGTGGVLDNKIEDTEWEEIEYDCDDYPTLIVSFYSEPLYKDIMRESELTCGQALSIPNQAHSFNFSYKRDGVFLYQADGCTVTDKRPVKETRSSIYDLKGFRNRISSASIDYTHTAYIGILFEEVDLKGACYYIHPNIGCDSLDREDQGYTPFDNKASSVAVYEYDFNPGGAGVTFYRNSFYKSKGGYLTVESSDIDGIYMGKLEDLKFVGNLDDIDDDGSIDEDDCNVPEEERDCVDWNFKGECVRRECPDLTGKDISSMSIDGDYFVLFVSFDPIRGEWAACQGFPTPDDKKKIGPRQLKWEYIHSPGRFPTHVYIFPIK